MTLPSGSLTAADIATTGRASVTVFSVGTGQCVLVVCPNGSRILNDCGSRTKDKDAGLINAALLSFNQVLNANSNAALYVVASHADDDHYSLVKRFVTSSGGVGARRVERVVLGGAQADYSADFTSWLDTLRTSQGAKTPVTADLAADYHDPDGTPYANIPCGTQASDGVYLLAANLGSSKNEQSVVMKLRVGTLSATMMGDAGGDVTETIIQNYATANGFLQSTFLVAAHHGAESNGANAPDWALQVLPRAVVYSAGTGYPNYGHPRCTSQSTYGTITGQRIAAAAAHAFTCYQMANDDDTTNISTAQYNTRDSGAVVVLFEGSSWGLWTCSGNTIVANNCAKSAPAGLVQIEHRGNHVAAADAASERHKANEAVP